MISVEEAQARIAALLRVMESEAVDLAEAGGRVLSEAVVAQRDQPPFSASAMDGWALRAQDCAPGARLSIVGESHAGNRLARALAPGEAARIFTGGPVPAGADAVLIQEDATRDGGALLPQTTLNTGANIRSQGNDFKSGFSFKPPRRLSPGDVALLAAMGCARPMARRRPRIALAATGDELVPPGAAPGRDQIFASNQYGLATLLTECGALPHILPIIRDDLDETVRALREAAAQADLVVTLGGASVGDRDLVGKAIGALDFWKVAMRPGKPLMAGRIGDTPMIGLPGNPVSAMVCGEVFLRPAIALMLGLDPASATERRPLAEALPANGPRTHFMRGRDVGGAVAAAPDQDSAMLSVLSGADLLIRRAPHAPPAQPGDTIDVLLLRRPS